MRQTTNYQLPSWDAEDRILREDFNDLTEKIDTALTEDDAALADQASELTQLASQLDAKGNCQIYFTSYTGTGTYGEANKKTLTFPHKPLVVMISLCEDSGYNMLAIYGAPMVYGRATGSSYGYSSWGSRTFTWYSNNASAHFNESGKVYNVVALMDVTN